MTFHFYPRNNTRWSSTTCGTTRGLQTQRVFYYEHATTQVIVNKTNISLTANTNQLRKKIMQNTFIEKKNHSISITRFRGQSVGVARLLII